MSNEPEMSFDDAIAAEGRGPRRASNICWYDRFAEARPADLNRLNELLGEITAGERTAASLSRILAKVGFKVRGGTINRHLRNDCECRRGE